MDFCYKFK